MKTITRRNFIRTGAAAVGTMAVPSVLSKGWFALPAKAAEPGYFESEFGISDGLCRKVLAEALAKGGDFADLYFEHTISNYLMLEDGQVNRAACDVALGVGIRTVKGDQVGYGFTQDFGEKGMLAAASTAATIADAKATGPAGEFIPLKTGSFYPMATLFTSVPLGSKLPIVQSTNDRCFALSPLVTKVSVMFHDQQKRLMIVTSDGVKAEDLQPRIVPQCRRRRRKERPARAVRLEHRRLQGVLLLHPGRRREDRRDRRRADAGPVRCRPAARRRSARRPRARRHGHPAPRGHRSRDGGRFQPEEDVNLQHHDREESRRAFRLHPR